MWPYSFANYVSTLQAFPLLAVIKLSSVCLSTCELPELTMDDQFNALIPCNLCIRAHRFQHAHDRNFPSPELMNLRGATSARITGFWRCACFLFRLTDMRILPDSCRVANAKTKLGCWDIPSSLRVIVLVNTYPKLESQTRLTIGIMRVVGFAIVNRDFTLRIVYYC